MRPTILTAFQTEESNAERFSPPPTSSYVKEIWTLQIADRMYNHPRRLNEPQSHGPSRSARSRMPRSLISPFHRSRKLPANLDSWVTRGYASHNRKEARPCTTTPRRIVLIQSKISDQNTPLKMFPCLPLPIVFDPVPICLRPVHPARHAGNTAKLLAINASARLEYSFMVNKWAVVLYIYTHLLTTEKNKMTCPSVDSYAFSVILFTRLLDVQV